MCGGLGAMAGALAGGPWERLLGRRPFFVGANLELKAWEIRRRGELSHAVLGIVFGTTNRAGKTSARPTLPE